ncbi:Uncharacterised protein [uncultured archaeon]|nr:Uncharacterised protein [uncultured archaeon]
MIKSNSKRGWIEIVEAFVAVLLVAGVLLVVINKGTFGKTDISEQVYTSQLSILREIETNDAFRSEILAVPILPAKVPTDIQDRINLRAPNYLICQGQICLLSDKCVLSSAVEKDVYAQAVVITTTLQQGSGATGTIAVNANGAVTGITITNGGTRYNNGVSVIIGGGSGATGTITTDTNGVITGITITAGGTGYTNGATATISNAYRQLKLFCWTK